MVIENRSVDHKELKIKVEQGNLCLNDFKKLIIQYRRQMADVNMLSSYKDCGILRVGGR